MGDSSCDTKIMSFLMRLQVWLRRVTLKSKGPEGASRRALVSDVPDVSLSYAVSSNKRYHQKSFASHVFSRLS